MRVDLFLKTSRLIKRRTVAQELCDTGRVLVNDHVAKPAKEVRQGDLITLLFSTSRRDIEVLDIPIAKSIKPEELYRIVEREARTRS